MEEEVLEFNEILSEITASHKSKTTFRCVLEMKVGEKRVISYENDLNEVLKEIDEQIDESMLNWKLKEYGQSEEIKIYSELLSKMIFALQTTKYLFFK